MNEKKHARRPGWIDPDDAPALTDDFFERADEYLGDTRVARGDAIEGAMSGSKTNRASLEALQAAVQAVPPENDFVWDGKDEDDRPASAQELSAALKEWLKTHSPAQ